ncbi:CpaD family pilus assembly protein [Marinomonas posidonica]|uniref:Pilus (Caulobacter type) biogenesis lipoprotein CpaD n=1 Tax=Marinomonas posidonica (strain CECT 7376 / NCIMB 14433 / IVIA-Po-181) TaxID=491952 RepID=F6CWJ3_MARPP|nr:CpaD family pilus assembly protein [Marinomonas posidonica]AEF53248.1 pilus (Caulobacter type) biogenesis lipoprotein CpaD [Marinomonas posidonica IVIA-Po-181]
MRILSIGVVFLLFLSGCDHTVHRLRNGSAEAEKGTPAFVVKPTVSSISLTLQENGSLKRSALDAVNALLRNQGRLSSQEIWLQPYTDKGDEFASHLKASLLSLGVQENKLEVLPIQYQATATSPSSTKDKPEAWDLSLRSEAMVVVTKNCGIQDSQAWSVNPYKAIGTLGCANRVNLAQMVADPRDLIRGRTLDDADGIHAVEAMTRYHESDVTPLLDIDFNED